MEYELTPLGIDPLKPVGALGEWALQNAERVENAQRRYDEAQESTKTAASQGNIRRLAPAANGDRQRVD